MNPGYRKGRRREYSTMRVLESAGYATFRMAGSHSPIDVIGLSRLGVRLVQVKAGKANVTPLDREKLKGLDRPPNTSIEVWRWRAGSREPAIEVL